MQVVGNSVAHHPGLSAVNTATRSAVLYDDPLCRQNYFVSTAATSMLRFQRHVSIIKHVLYSWAQGAERYRNKKEWHRQNMMTMGLGKEHGLERACG